MQILLPRCHSCGLIRREHLLLPQRALQVSCRSLYAQSGKQKPRIEHSMGALLIGAKTNRYADCLTVVGWAYMLMFGEDPCEYLVG